MKKDSKIYIAGHTGLVGSAIQKSLLEKGYENILTIKHSELELINYSEVKSFFQKEKPEYVILSAAKVGGIKANDLYRAEFIYQNMQIQNNIIHSSYLNKVKKLLFLGSSCIYPKDCPQPIKEEYLLTGELEYTNEPYAIAKIAGIKMCESYNLQYGTNFISVMPTNLYGSNDNYDFEKSHVLPALIRKIYLAKLLQEENFTLINKNLNSKNNLESLEILKKIGIEKEQIEIWGTGTPRREFLHSKDLADACVFLMENIDFEFIVSELKKTKQDIKNTHINIGTGIDITIKELVELIAEIIDFKGEFSFNALKPDGTKQKLLDTSKINNFGWKEKISLKNGIKMVFDEYKNKSI